jgi:hypothetical protein
MRNAKRLCETSFTRGAQLFNSLFAGFHRAGHKCTWSLMLIWSLELTSFQASRAKQMELSTTSDLGYRSSRHLTTVHKTNAGAGLARFRVHQSQCQRTTCPELVCHNSRFAVGADFKGVSRLNFSLNLFSFLEIPRENNPQVWLQELLLW